MRRQVSLVIALGIVSPTIGHADDESPPLSIYGFARLDALADSAPMSSLAQPQWVMLAPAGGTTVGEATMTPRLSRVGLSIDKWDLADGGVISGEGKLEVDFAGGSGTNALRLRHAYGAIELSHYAELLAGQTWDLISPLIPSAQNDTQLLFAGNTGDRRPQVRLSVMPTKKFTIAVAVATSGTLLAIDQAAPLPAAMATSPALMVQWLAEYHPTTRFGEEARIGVWGHVARDDLANGMHSPERSVGGHLYLPVAGKFALFGEIYTGTNTADIGGGIGQGLNATTGNPIRSTGGWGELAVMPGDHHMVSLGASIDTAVSDDLEPGDRERNSTAYAVVRYKPRPTLQLAAEYVNWRTQYKAMGDAVSNRVDLHLSVFF